MTKYQVFAKTNEQYHAASKAHTDVYQVLSKYGYSDIVIQLKNYKRKITGIPYRKFMIYKGWADAFFKIRQGDVLFWQGPNDYTTLVGTWFIGKLKKIKKIRLISLLHDIDELRYDDSDYLRESKAQHECMIKYSDAIIVHTDRMKEYLCSKGVDKSKIVTLEVFDYLCNKAETIHEIKNIVTIAGNLDKDKGGYIYHLNEVDDITFTLFGPNYNDTVTQDNVAYEGIVNPLDLPEHLNEGFGLVWDGNSLDCCDGKMGEYLKYNSPHKLSLYLASGIPVIIWEKAAQADYVRKYKVGICVDSIRSIAKTLNGIDSNSLTAIMEGLKDISIKIRSGYFMSSAIQKAEKICNITNEQD